MERIPIHNHNGIDSNKIKVYHIIPTYNMTSAQLTKYLSRPAIDGEEFNVYISDEDKTVKYIMVNNEWSEVGSQVILGCEASDTLQYSLDTERVVNGLSSGVCKSIKIYKSGTVRVTGEYHLTAGYVHYDAYIQINGVNVYTMPDRTATSYTSFSYDATVNFGDEIQFYVSLRGAPSSNYYIRNFRISYTDVILTEIPDATIKDSNL